MSKRQFILKIETDDEEYTFNDLFENVSYAIRDMVHPSDYHIAMKEVEKTETQAGGKSNV